MDDRTNPLPADVESLRQLCLAQARLLEANKKQLAHQENSLHQRDQRIEILEEFIRFLQQKKYKASSERHINQLCLFDDETRSLVEPIEDNASAIDESTSQNTVPPGQAKPKKNPPGRRKLPENLPRVQVYHDLTSQEKQCSCGCELTMFDEVISEQLGIIPAKLYVIQHCRKKYRCSSCESTVKTAALPPQPIPKSNASPELIAHSIVAKFLDGLPFYRQEKIWERGGGIKLTRATLANWSIQSATVSTPLINLLIEKQREGPVMHIDETPVQVLKEPGKSPTSDKRFWVMVGGPPDKPVYRFYYHPSRGSAVAEDLLQDYHGTVISDDWAVYARVCETLGLPHIACNDHARRKFKDAIKPFAKRKKSKGKSQKAANTSRAEQALHYYQQLYAIERDIKALSPDEKKNIRQQKSVPIWQHFKQWLEKNIQVVTPQSPLGKAIHYTYKLFDKLSAYCEDGHLPMSNEKAENAIRPFAIARKNFLFYDTPRGASASETHYSLIMTAKANGLDPFYYLAYVFKKMPLAKTVEDVEALLPWNLTDEETQSEFRFV